MPGGLLRTVAVLVLSVWASSARADMREVAKQHFAKAKQEFEAKRFTRALEEFRAAYALAPHPDFIFNIARCQEELDQLAESIENYDRYLAVAPNPDVRDHVEVLRRKLATRTRDLPPPPPGEPTRLPVTPAAPGVAPIAVVAAAPVMVRGKTPVYRRWWFWTTLVVVAAGGVAVGLGVGLTRPSSSLTFPPLSAQ